MISAFVGTPLGVRNGSKFDEAIAQNSAIRLGLAHLAPKPA